MNSQHSSCHTLAIFEIHQSPRNKLFFFRIKTGNHQVILASDGYLTKTSCTKGIASVQKNSTSGTAFKLKAGKDGRLSFTLDAKNGEVIGSSQMYKGTRSRAKGIASVIRNSAGRSVKDLSA